MKENKEIAVWFKDFEKGPLVFSNFLSSRKRWCTGLDPQDYSLSEKRLEEITRIRLLRTLFQSKENRINPSRK